MTSSRNGSSTSIKQQHDLADTASSPDAKKPRLREPKVNWTAEEDAQLAAGVKKYGTDTKAWNQIADTFNGTRDVKRCRERWQEYIDPSLSHVAFTDAEDTAILACQRHFGNQWKMIAEVMSKQHEHRSATAIKSRWHQLQKREKRMNKYAERMKSVRGSSKRQNCMLTSSIERKPSFDITDTTGGVARMYGDADVVSGYQMHNAAPQLTPNNVNFLQSSNLQEIQIAQYASTGLQILCDVAKSAVPQFECHTLIEPRQIPNINDCITAHIPSPKPLTAPMTQFTAAYERHMHTTPTEHCMQYPMMGYSAPYFPADVPATPTVWQYPPVYGNQYYNYNTMHHPLPPPAPQYLPHPVPFMQYPLQQAYYNNDEDEDEGFLVNDKCDGNSEDAL